MTCIPCIAAGTAILGGGGVLTSTNFKYYVIALVVYLIALCVYAYYSFINECEECKAI